MWFGDPARPDGRTVYFAAFGSWSGVLPKSAESLRDSDVLMRVAVPQASRPRWAALSLPVLVLHRRASEGCNRCDEGQREKFVNVTVVILIVVRVVAAV